MFPNQPRSTFPEGLAVGPAIALVPWAEKSKGMVTSILASIGRVPFFYYLLHIPLIHISALIVNYLLTGTTHNEWYDYAPFSNVPSDSRWNLSLLYLVFVIDVTILWLACRWYAGYKLGHPEKKWLKFL